MLNFIHSFMYVCMCGKLKWEKTHPAKRKKEWKRPIETKHNERMGWEAHTREAWYAKPSDKRVRRWQQRKDQLKRGGERGDEMGCGPSNHELRLMQCSAVPWKKRIPVL